MRILLISYRIPSDVSYDAVRARNLATFLLDRGHDVRVLSSSDADTAGDKRFDSGRIVLTPSRVELEAQHARTMRGKLASMLGAGRRKTDRAAAWLKPAVSEAELLFQTWMPDVIYATCPPHVATLVAAELAKLSDIPFVAEVRAPWFIDKNSTHPERRSQHDAEDLRKSLVSASALVTVSPAWAELYANRFGSEKVHIAMDGFDPQLYPLVATTSSDTDRQILQLHYAVSEEGAPENLKTLFEGIAALGAGAEDVRLTISGENSDAVVDIAKANRMERQIAIVPVGSQEQELQRQFSADALVLATRNDSQDAGKVPSELFNYIGARRPIIAMGYSKGNAAEIIRRRDLGVFSNEPKVIANRLAKLLAKKRAVGIVPPLPENVRENATIAAQFAGLEPMLYGVVGATPLNVAAE